MQVEDVHELMHRIVQDEQIKQLIDKLQEKSRFGYTYFNTLFFDVCDAQTRGLAENEEELKIYFASILFMYLAGYALVESLESKDWSLTTEKRKYTIKRAEHHDNEFMIVLTVYQNNHEIGTLTLKILGYIIASGYWREWYHKLKANETNYMALPINFYTLIGSNVYANLAMHIKDLNKSFLEDYITNYADDFSL